MTEVGDESSKIAKDFAWIVNRTTHDYLSDEIANLPNRPQIRYNVYGDTENDFIYVTTIINGNRYYGRSDSKIVDSTVKERRNYIAAGDKLLALGILDAIMKVFKDEEKIEDLDGKNLTNMPSCSIV